MIANPLCVGQRTDALATRAYAGVWKARGARPKVSVRVTIEIVKDVNMHATEQSAQSIESRDGPPDGWDEMLHDGTQIHIRSIRRRDVALEKRFIETLSPDSRRFRFLESMRSPSDALLKQLTDIDHTRDAAFIAVVVIDGVEREVGVARFNTSDTAETCEFAVTVSDEWQRKGLGTSLMRHLLESARARGIRTLYSSDAADNVAMRKFAEHLHFRHERDPDDAAQVKYSVDLQSQPSVEA